MAGGCGVACHATAARFLCRYTVVIPSEARNLLAIVKKFTLFNSFLHFLTFFIGVFGVILQKKITKNLHILQKCYIFAEELIMKWSELRRLAEQNGWRLVRHGGNHDIYEHDETSEKLIIGRHRSEEIRTGLMRKLIKQIEKR